MDAKQMIDYFVADAQESLQLFSEHLFQLEENPEDVDLLNVLFRIAHTIKGNANTIYGSVQQADPDYPSLHSILQMGEITHQMEDLIEAARDNGVTLTQDHVDAIFDTEEALTSLISLVAEDSNETYDASELIGRLRSLLGKKEAKKVVKEADIETDHHHRFQLEIDGDEDLIEAYLLSVYKDVEQSFPEAKFSPSKASLMEMEPFDDIFIYLPESFPISTFIETVSSFLNVKKVTFIENKKAKKESKSASQPKKKTQNTIRVSIDRIDDSMKNVASLSILKNKLANEADKLGSESIKELSEEFFKTIETLQTNMMSIRMTPLDDLFKRFPVDVRKQAKEHGKVIKFDYVGGDTEIDKALLDQLGDPLMHLIRNSVFHGIEKEEDRLANGKDASGSILLSASPENGHVVIKIKDDGKGIPVDKVTAKAIEKGVITEEEAKAMSYSERVNLIFSQGLSTADAVNTIAGRGVGMDAVKGIIVEKLKGFVTIHSEEDVGTTTTITLPLTLAIITALHTRIEGESYSFPGSFIERVYHVKKNELKKFRGNDIFVLNHKDVIEEIPVVSMQEFFGLPKAKDEVYDEDEIILIVLKNGERKIAAKIDSYARQEQIVVKQLGKYVKQTKGVSGCNILGDGSISLIVDVNDLFSEL